MAQFVLVPGAFLGAWCWRRVLPALRAAGHEVHVACLTGTGERAHLLSTRIRVDTHVNDVLQVVQAEELDELILVGHSYAGLVVTGVADRLLKASRPVLRRLVYVDAVLPHPGESWSSRQPPDAVAARVAAARANGGISLPPPDPSVYGLDGDDHAWLRRRQTHHPFSVYRDPLWFDAERVARVPRLYIDCNAPALPTVAAMRERVRHEPGWRVEVLPTGHVPMVTLPVALAALLLDEAAQVQGPAAAG